MILVVDARSITRSAAALVKGYIDFDPAVDIKGVILNKVGGSRHAEKAISAIRDHAGVEVVGVIPRDEAMHLAMRHLGLVPMLEGEKRHAGFVERLDKIRRVVEEGLDIDRILEIAAEAVPLEEPEPDLYRPSRQGEGVRIGVALDEAFNFYYRDNLELIELSGAEVVPVSPVHDHSLPEVDGLYIGGGYPELYAKELSENRSMIESIRRAHEDDIPIFAECGGLMYLCEEIDWGGEALPAVGLVPAKTRRGAAGSSATLRGSFFATAPWGPRARHSWATSFTTRSWSLTTTQKPKSSTPSTSGGGRGSMGERRDRRWEPRRLLQPLPRSILSALSEPFYKVSPRGKG